MVLPDFLAGQAIARWRRRSIRTGRPGATSLRARILLVTALAISPTVLFASGIALQHAYGAQGFLLSAAWLTAAAVPLLTGLAAVITVSLAAEGLILRWLVYLERVARAYGRGRYSVRPHRLQLAPLEFMSVGAAVADMATAIDDRDHALRIALEEQSVLLREVHHRVKNNLQIVGSLLSLQAARSSDAKVKSAIRDALVRIDTLALSQRFMKPTEGKDTVSASEIFGGLVSQLRARLRRPGALSLTLDIEDLTLDLEFAGRLVLIAGEVILVATHRASQNPLSINLRLRGQDTGAVVLTISTDNAATLLQSAPGDISLGLIDGYLKQVRGRVEAAADPSQLTILAYA